MQRRHLMQLAEEGGVARATAAATIDRMLEQASGFLLRASAFQIRRETVHDMAKVIAKCRGLMAS